MFTAKQIAPKPLCNAMIKLPALAGVAFCMIFEYADGKSQKFDSPLFSRHIHQRRTEDFRSIPIKHCLKGRSSVAIAMLHLAADAVGTPAITVSDRVDGTFEPNVQGVSGHKLKIDEVFLITI